MTSPMIATLRTKLLIGMVPLLALVVGLGIWAITLFNRLGNNIEVILRENYRSVLAAQSMKESLERMDSALWFAIGGKYQASKQLTLDFGYAYLMVKDASINQRKGIGTAPFQGNVVGNYTDPNVHILSAQASYNF